MTKKVDSLLFLQLTILAYGITLMLKGKFDGDFWEHAAIIKQLSHSWTYRHPIYHIDAPHAFYSPYLFFWAGISKIIQLGPILTLTTAGIVNLIAWIYLIPKFISLWFDNRNVQALTIVISLLFWNIPHWFSGFYSINVLHFVLPYPSTVGFILLMLSFLILGKSNNRYGIYFSGLIAGVNLVIHPLSGLMTVIGLICYYIFRDNKSNRNYLAFGISLLICAGIPLLWPYYSFIELATEYSDVFHSGNEAMYDSPIKRSYPAILAIPIMIFYITKKQHQDLILFFAMLTGLFLFGWISEKYSYGRVLGLMAIICHMFLADFLLTFYERIKHKALHKWATVILFFVFCIHYIRKNAELHYFQPIDKWFITHNENEVIRGSIEDNDMIMGQPELVWKFPAFGGGIIQAKHAQAFINDEIERKEDVELFFSTQTTKTERKRLLEKYGANIILITKGVDEMIFEQFSSEMIIVHQDDQLVILRKP